LETEETEPAETTDPVVIRARAVEVLNIAIKKKKNLRT
jgi:hypothetical protein